MDETKMTAAEMLAQVNTAITTVLCGGQSYKIGSNFCTFIHGPPPGIYPAMPCGVIASQFIQPLPPHFPLVGPARGHGGDHIIKPAHADHLPSKNAT